MNSECCPGSFRFFDYSIIKRCIPRNFAMLLLKKSSRRNTKGSTQKTTSQINMKSFPIPSSEGKTKIPLSNCRSRQNPTRIIIAVRTHPASATYLHLSIPTTIQPISAPALATRKTTAPAISNLPTYTRMDGLKPSWPSLDQPFDPDRGPLMQP
jgi:hypothetical protein